MEPQRIETAIGVRRLTPEEVARVREASRPPPEEPPREEEPPAA